VDVKYRWNRGWRSSHLWISGSCRGSVIRAGRRQYRDAGRGPVKGSAISSPHTRPGNLRRGHIWANDVADLLDELGSVDSFHVWMMCGLSPNALQMRDTADWDLLADLAIDRVDQWLFPFGAPAPASR
jgi:hypothetical protein